MWNRCLAVLLITLVGSAPTAVDAKRPTLTISEQQQLPKYCWSRHVDKKYAGVPGHSIPGICGKKMNHMCNGHIYLIAAQRPTAAPRDRNFYAQKAVGEFRYTQGGMTPECPLRADLDAAMSLAKFLQKRR